MNDAQFLSVAWNQLIQVSLLTVSVWLLTKIFARNRPHLAHAMWLVVLAKCVTPPLLASPTGLFGHLSVPEPVWFEPEEIVVEQAIEPIVPEPRVVASNPEFESEIAVDPLSQGYVLEDDALLGQLMFEDTAFELDDEPVESVAAISKPPVAEPSVTFLPLWKLWLISAGTVMSLIFLRVICTLWRVKRHRTETPPELLELVQTLSKQFGLRRRVRVLITSSRVGPAVVGLFRPLLILPDVVTNGRSAKELEPIVAHELLHVRRGDLGIGWLQVLVQSLWWFHPLIWLVNRLLNRETERCCDEAVLAELNCSPGTYARCLLNVLEQKRNLTPIPAFPGVKPVELTKQRMERIMKLGQGCRKKSPWWCWLVVLLLGAVVLPGTARSQTDAVAPEKSARTTEPDSVAVEATESNTNVQEPRTARVYEVGNLLATLRDEYEFTATEAERALEHSLFNALATLEVARKLRQSSSAEKLTSQNVCSGTALFAVNDKEGHQQIERLLELWKDHGFYEVTIEGCMATVPVGFLATNLPSNQRVPLEHTESDKITTPALPSLTLSYKEYKELQELIQSDTRSNLIAFPRITIPHGTRASVMDIVQHPYIVGYKGDEPIIEVLKKGLELQLNPLVREGTLTQLDCNVRHSQLHKAGGRRSREDLFEKQIELPVQALNVARMNVSLLLKSGETTLLRGLKNKSGEVEEELLVFLSATPRKLNREFLEPVADAREKPTGKLLFGAGVNSEAGVTGSVVLEERNFDLKSPLIFWSGKSIEADQISLNLPNLSEEQQTSYFEELTKCSKTLGRIESAKYVDTPRSEVLRDLQRKTGSTFIIERGRIADAEGWLKKPISFEISSRSGLSLRSILRMVLQDEKTLEFCTIPGSGPKSGNVKPIVLISTYPQIVQWSLQMQSQSIPHLCSIEDLQQKQESGEIVRFIQERLDKPIAVKLEDQQLSDAFNEISNKAGINIHLELASLPETLSANSPVKDYQSEVDTTLREALEEICTPLGLIFVVEDEFLKIVGKEWYGRQTILMVYPFAKLFGNDAQAEARLHEVSDRIKATVEPESWTVESGYDIFISKSTTSLVVRHKRKTHEAIAELLSKVRLETGVNRDQPQNPDAEIEVLLDHALQSYATHLKRELLIDEAALATLDIPIDQRVKVYSLKTHAPETALKETLQPLGLTHALHDRKLPNQGGAQPMLLVFEQRLLDSHDGPLPYDRLVEMMLERNKQILRHAGDRVAKEQARLRRRIPHDIHAPTLQAGLELFEKVADVSIEIEPKVLKAAEARFLEARTTDQRLTWEIRDREFISALRHSLAPLDLVPVVTHRGARHNPQIVVRIVPKDAAESAQASPPRVFPHPVDRAAKDEDEAFATVQIQFQKHEKFRLMIDRYEERRQLSSLHELPVRQNFRAGGQSFRLTFQDTPERIVKSDWPVPIRASRRNYSWTLDIPEMTEQSRKYLAHNAVPVALTDEDLDQIDAGNPVTKVVYLPHPDRQELAIANVETIVSTRLDPSKDAVEEAKKRGTIVAVMRSNRTSQDPFDGTVRISPSLVIPPMGRFPRKLNWDDGAWKLDFTGDPTVSPESKGVEQAISKEATHKKDNQDDRVISKVYPVADLVVPIPGTESDPVKDDPILSKLPNQSKLFKVKKKPLSVSAHPLIDLIRKSIEPESWTGDESVGTIAFDEQKLSLVIRHKESVHQKISELLTTLRSKQDLQVTLECLTVQFEKDSFSDFWTNVGIVIDHADTNAKNSMKPLIFHGVKRDDFRSKIDQFEAAKVLSFPKLTVFNGVGAQIQISGAGADEEAVPMMHYMIVPTISEDRRTIDVKFAVNAANTLDALTKAKSMTIPDGRSVLIEVTDELLSGQKRTGVPEVDKALRELKKKELGLRTFVLLTPRIIIQEEEEELLGIPQSKAEQPASDSNTRVGTVTPRIIIQEEEEALLRLPQPTAELKDRSPAPAPAPVRASPSP